MSLSLTFGAVYLYCPSHRCKNEKWKSDYEADPFDEKDKARLENKRKDRNTCQCHLGIESASAYDDR